MTNVQKKILMLVLLIFGCVATGIVSEYCTKSETNNSKSLISTEEFNLAPKKASIKIYISGAVLKPGVYEFSSEIRAEEAIYAAGGFTEFADLERVNLAKKLKDGMQVNVPVRRAQRTVTKSAEKTKQSKEGSAPKNTENKKQAKQNGVINLNTATSKELECVPGIGPVMAERIIAFREDKKFSSVEDLLKVKGIGKAKLEKIKEHVKAE